MDAPLVLVVGAAEDEAVVAGVGAGVGGLLTVQRTSPQRASRRLQRLHCVAWVGFLRYGGVAVALAGDAFLRRRGCTVPPRPTTPPPPTGAGTSTWKPCERGGGRPVGPTSPDSWQPQKTSSCLLMHGVKWPGRERISRRRGSANCSGLSWASMLSKRGISPRCQRTTTRSQRCISANTASSTTSRMPPSAATRQSVTGGTRQDARSTARTAYLCLRWTALCTRSTAVTSARCPNSSSTTKLSSTTCRPSCSTSWCSGTNKVPRCSGTSPKKRLKTPPTISRAFSPSRTSSAKAGASC